MKKQSWLLIATLSLATLASAGCATRVHGYGYAGYAQGPPPPVRYEVYGRAPGPDYVWIGGNWRWGGSQYYWNSGRWARAPHARARWVPGHWRQHNNRYRWREGRWR